MSQIETVFEMPSDLDLALGLEFRIFDPQVCDEIKLEWLIDTVEKHGITAAEVEKIIDDGLVRRWKSPKGNEGVLLYSERQVRVAKALHDSGRYSDAELRNIFDDWNSMLEICMIDHLAYDSFEIDNYEHFRRRSAGELAFYKDQLEQIARGATPWMGDHQKQTTREHFEFWSRWHALVSTREDQSLSNQTRLNWRKALAHQRFVDEYTRITTADAFAILVEQGYSSDVVFNGHSVSKDGYELTHLDWRSTLQRFKETRNEGKLFPLRTPDFTIAENGIAFAELPTPETLKTLHDKYELDTLRTLLSEWGPSLWQCDLAASGRAECPECEKPFERTKASRKYCSDACRNRAKQRRFRENNPEKAGATQARYYGQAYPEVLV